MLKMVSLSQLTKQGIVIPVTYGTVGRLHDWWMLTQYYKRYKIPTIWVSMECAYQTLLNMLAKFNGWTVVS